MKVKTIVIFSNGSTSFCNTNLSSFNIKDQYHFYKKTDKTFFVYIKKKQQINTDVQFSKYKKNNLNKNFT